MRNQTFEFPVGYHKLHPAKIMDFQLNRWHSYGYLRLEDLRRAARQIRTLEDWTPEMTRQAKKAAAEGRMTEAAFFYRSAEFFALPTDPDKRILYDTFQDIFYGHVFDVHRAERIDVPYEGAHLPALRIQAQGDQKGGTLVAHGGFDSFMEEFYSMGLWFSDRGFEVILFEGPGQGGALKKSGFALTHEWERPAKAVLNHFNAHDVSWLGISLGGWLCFRAAAFEPRITRVIASSIAFDYLQMVSPPVQWFVRTLLRYPRVMNGMAILKARLLPQERWGLHHMMYIFNVQTPIEAIVKFLEFNERNQHTDRIRQDVLILTGAEDHFIPLKMHDMQVSALNSARSVTGRIFTAAEHAQNHCQVGNWGLALREMVKWMSSLENADPGNREVEAAGAHGRAVRKPH
jgi:pimeloyl-ACP methyl ester carboxylesterase